MKKDFQTIEILISSLKIILEIEKDLVNIQRLFGLLKNSKGVNNFNNKIKITIKEDKKRYIKLSLNKRHLIIAGYNIDDLSNPFNLIGLLQAFFRFVGLHSIKNNLFLLHGSAAIFNKNALCFADDGESTAKTLSSIEIALTSNEYIGDEFCFLNKNGVISSYSFIPIHIRIQIANYFNKYHKKFFDSFKDNNKSCAGYFISPKNNFRNIKSKRLSAIIFVHFNVKKEKDRFKKLTKKESKQAVLKSILSHIAKLFNPKLDRMNFVEEKDSTKKIIYDKDFLNSIKRELKLNGSIENLIKNIPCYRIYISKPQDIVKIIEKIEP